MHVLLVATTVPPELTEATDSFSGAVLASKSRRLGQCEIDGMARFLDSKCAHVHMLPRRFGIGVEAHSLARAGCSSYRSRLRFVERAHGLSYQLRSLRPNLPPEVRA